MTITHEMLAGGHLLDVMTERMVATEQARKTFARSLSTVKAARQTLRSFERFFGWKVPQELVEWVRAAKTGESFFASTQLRWRPIEGALLAPGKGGAGDVSINSSRIQVTALTGFDWLAINGSEQYCLVNTLPHPSGLGEVGIADIYRALDTRIYRSLAEFVFQQVIIDHPRPSRSDDKHQLHALLESQIASALNQRPWYHDARALYLRSQWLLSPLIGLWVDDRLLPKAPTFAVWQNEKTLCSTQPCVAVYWVLAHHFLGNLSACEEACALALSAPGVVAPAFAAAVLEELKIPTARQGFVLVRKSRFQELRGAIRERVSPEHLEPKR